MSFALEYQITHDSLTAWGTGLQYNYEDDIQSLNISRLGKERPFATFHFDHHMSRDPLTYITALEKACQIKALMLSNNTTVNLAETLNCVQLNAIINSAASLSRYAYDLKTLRLRQFCDAFSDEFDLKTVKIKKFKSRKQGNEFFIARVQTKHDNTICVRACTLAGITAAMSDKTIRDLITMEFGHSFEGSAHNLLSVSTRLSSLSYILDDTFIPMRRIRPLTLNEETNIVH